MLYAQTILALMDKEKFNKYSKYLNKQFFGSDKSPWWDMYLRIKDYHDKHEGNISIDALKQAHLLSLSGGLESKRVAVEQLYTVLEGTTMSDEADYLLPKIRRHGVLSEAGEELAKELQDNKEADLISIAEKLSTVASEEFEDEEIAYTIDILESEADYAASRQWKWFHPQLDECVQGAGPERNCLIVALTNVGKTSFVCRSNVDFMRQGAKVLHFAIAEDSKVSLQRRYYQAAYGVNDYELDQEKRRYRDQFMQEFEGKLTLVPIDSLSIGQAEEVIKRVRPDIVVFDDFKDLELDKKRNEPKEHKQYGIIAVKIKSLAIKYGFFALCCAQAADSATGKRWLDRGDIADSKVDIPAKFQYVLGLAKGDGDGSSVRYLSTIKNKLGPEDMKVSMNVDEARCDWQWH
jgi:hypothetical protein